MNWIERPRGASDKAWDAVCVAANAILAHDAALQGIAQRAEDETGRLFLDNVKLREQLAAVSPLPPIQP